MRMETPSRAEPRMSTLITAGIVAAALFYFGIITDNFILRLITKPLPILPMMALVYHHARDHYGRFIFSGLFFCMIGDVLLMFADFFLFGMAAFFIGHACFVAAFVRVSRHWHPLRALPFAVWIGYLMYVTWDRLGDLQWAVPVYAATIGIMMWRASA
ncbi:MAG: lysoplasmalogenase, partial [Leptospiraceae bacterium]|nr:lysoplasmalogenase [Leptospiraceae bacterium]